MTASLRVAIDVNPAAWLDVLARQPGAEVHDHWVLTDVPFALCNSIFFPAWSGDEAEARIDEVLAAGRARGVSQLWWLGTGSADTVRILEARGAVVDREELPGMALDLARLAQTARPAPRELRIEPVASAAALDDFAVAFGAAYHFPPAALESVVAAIAAYGLDGDVRHFVGYAARRPVCAASIVVRDGVGGLYDVATVAAARGRGYGAAVSAHALRAAGDAGAHGAILHASPEGMPIYERLGFEVVGAVQTVETHL